MTTESEPALGAWAGLHPVSLLVNLVPRAVGVLRTFWPFLLAIIWGSQDSAAGLADAFVVLVFFGMTVLSTAVHFFTLRYRVIDDRLEIRSGLVNRQVRSIDVARIQNVQTTRNVFHRLSGLVEVQVETASGREVEGLLSALTEERGTALVAALQAGAARAQRDEPESEGVVVVRNDFGDLVWYGATATRWGVAVLFVVGGMEALQWVDPMRLGGLLAGMGLVVAVLAGLSGAWVLGVIGSVVRHHGFRLVERGRLLVAEEGLFTKRRVQLREEKVQRVVLLEPALRRAAGFLSVRVETAAAFSSGEGGGQRRSETLVPVVDRARWEDILTRLLPRAGLAGLHSLRPPHPAALRRGLLQATIRGLVLGGLAFWYFGAWGALGFLLVPIGIALAVLDHRHQGWRVTDDLVVSRRGWLRRVTEVAPRRKIQAVTRVQGPLMRRWGLARVQVRVAGAIVTLPDTGTAESAALADALADLPAPVKLQHPPRSEPLWDPDGPTDEQPIRHPLPGADGEGGVGAGEAAQGDASGGPGEGADEG